jgi:hypothetical protein
VESVGAKPTTFRKIVAEPDKYGDASQVERLSQRGVSALEVVQGRGV